MQSKEKCWDIPTLGNWYSNPDDPKFLVFMRKKFWIQTGSESEKVNAGSGLN
jgi:hypothetical protein